MSEGRGATHGLTKEQAEAPAWYLARYRAAAIEADIAYDMARFGEGAA